MSRPELTLVVPLQSQEAFVSALDERLKQLLPTLGTSAEVIFVDDASTDGTLPLLRRLAERESRYRVLALSRSFGYERALGAGIDKARGNAVIVLDADVAEIGDVVQALLAKWREGYDVVYGRRRPRFGESTFNVQAQKLFDSVFTAITPIDVPRSTGNVRLMSRRVVRTMRGLHETHRFVRGLVAWVGFKQTAVEYDGAFNAPGSRTPPLKRVSSALDLVTSFSTLPLRVASVLALFGAVFALLFAFVAVLSHDSTTSPPGWTSLVVLGALFASVVFAILAVFGTYLGRIYEQAKRRPLYLVAERINFRQRKEQKLSTSDFAEVTVALPGAPALPPVAPVAPVAPAPAPPPVAPVAPAAPAPAPAPVAPIAPAPPPPVMTQTARISVFSRPLTPPPPSVRPKAPSYSNLPAPPRAPSIPPPTVMRASTPPPPRPGSIPPPSALTSKPPSIAPARPSAAPKPAVKLPSAPSAPQDAKKLFGGERAPADSSKEAPLLPLEEPEDRTLIETRESIESRKPGS